MTKFLLFLSAILLVGCSTTTAESVDAPVEDGIELDLLFTSLNLRVYSFKDVSGAKCWVYDGSYSGGIECLLISE